MTRFRSIAIAVTALALSTGAVFAFSDLPGQALDALGPATEHAGRDLPARPETLPVAADERTGVATETSVELTAEDLPDAASHGAAVSDAAKPADLPADSDHGKAVSEVARDNNGAAAVEEHKPADAGTPDSAGKPADPGPPDTVVTPDPAPDDPGPPADPGKPTDRGRPN